MMADSTSLSMLFALILVIALAVLLVIIALRTGHAARAASELVTDLRDVKGQIATLQTSALRLEDELRAELGRARTEAAGQAQLARTEFAGNVALVSQSLHKQLSTMAHVQNEQLDAFALRLSVLTQTNEERLHAVRATIDERLEALRSDNAQKLEQMRATVDEKLHATLEKRLGDSFKLVSDRLELVHRGLGEMQALATGVGDLKKVLTNVKTRGGWGEMQLASLLEDMLAPGQYDKNVAVRPGRSERVEFAIRFPGRDADDRPCWLPIDAKFPREDYERLQHALENADVHAIEASRRALESFFRVQAREIRNKYIEPPHTTDFAILFLPTESLYAEVMARRGLAEALQREHRVVLAGPMNLAAILNSLQMGFRTLAIEKRSSEVWRVLGAVKTEFGRFGDLLAKTKKQLDTVSNSLSDAEVRTRAIERNLRGVEALPENEAARLIEEGDLSATLPQSEAELNLAPLPSLPSSNATR